EVDHRRQRGGLAGSGRARDEDEAAGLVEEFPDRGRNADLFEGEQLVRDLAQDHPEIALFLEHADPEAGQVAEGESEVRAAAFTDAAYLFLRGDGSHQFLGVLLTEGGTFDAMEGAMDAQHGRRP